MNSSNPSPAFPIPVSASIRAKSRIDRRVRPPVAERVLFQASSFVVNQVCTRCRVNRPVHVRVSCCVLSGISQWLAEPRLAGRSANGRASSGLLVVIGYHVEHHLVSTCSTVSYDKLNLRPRLSWNSFIVNVNIFGQTIFITNRLTLYG